MRAYIITSGLLFAALVLAHALRLAAEGFAVAAWTAWVLKRGARDR